MQQFTHMTLADGLARVLPEFEYVKNAGHFVRTTGTVAHIIDIQSQKARGGPTYSLTLNCGIYIPGVTSRFRGAQDPAIPRALDCCLSVRLGMLAPARIDRWWVVQSGTKSILSATDLDEAKNMVTQYGLPFLGRFMIEEDVARFLASPRPKGLEQVMPVSKALCYSYAALIWSRVGKHNESSSSLLLAVKASQGTPLEATVVAFSNTFAA